MTPSAASSRSASRPTTAAPLGPDDAKATLRIRSRDGLARFLSRPGELGIVRAYVSGDVDLDGDLFALLEEAVGLDLSLWRVDPAAVTRLLRETGLSVLRSPTPPPEEARVSGGLHTKSRDRAAISHHYDVSNDFYRLVLGPSMTYSCAVFSSPEDSLEQAQANKHDLICRKLGLQPGMRLLDVGCGWGAMVMHAAANYGVEAVGVTISSEQAALARQRVEEAGLADRVEIRLEDYRDVTDGPYDAISSIGMFEHVGRRRMEEYFVDLYGLLPSRGPPAEPRHQPSRLPPGRQPARTGPGPPAPDLHRDRLRLHVADRQPAR